MSYFSHESAYVDEGSHIGDGTKIWHFSHVLPGAKIGKDCVLGQNVSVAGSVIVGDRCKIQNNVSLYDGVTLEDEVFCGPSCVFTNDHNPRSHGPSTWKISPTVVKRGASIGANATIICGNTIGSYAMVGSGAVVSHDVADHSLVVGVPARAIGWVCRCGNVLSNDFVCPQCKTLYKLKERGLSPAT